MHASTSTGARGGSSTAEMHVGPRGVEGLVHRFRATLQFRVCGTQAEFAVCRVSLRVRRKLAVPCLRCCDAEMVFILS